MDQGWTQSLKSKDIGRWGQGKKGLGVWESCNESVAIHTQVVLSAKSQPWVGKGPDKLHIRSVNRSSCAYVDRVHKERLHLVLIKWMQVQSQATIIGESDLTQGRSEV